MTTEETARLADKRRSIGRLTKCLHSLYEKQEAVGQADMKRTTLIFLLCARTRLLPASIDMPMKLVACYQSHELLKYDMKN